MHDCQIPLVASNGRTPWNKNRVIGPKPPLRPKHVWAIRTKPQIEEKARDLAMFNLAIDSKLRGCDVVALKVEDVAPGGDAIERATVRQKKTGQPVRFEVTEQTRKAVDPTLIYRRTGNVRAVQLLLGHRKIESTARYLGIEVDDALAIAEQSTSETTGQSGHALPLHVGQGLTQSELMRELVRSRRITSEKRHDSAQVRVGPPRNRK